MGESSFWYRPTRVVPDQRPLNGRCCCCCCCCQCLAYLSNTHPLNGGPFSGTTQVNRYQKGKTSLDFTEASDSEWKWHQLGEMQVCTSHQTKNHASTPPLSFFSGRIPSSRPTNSVKALMAISVCIKLKR